MNSCDFPESLHSVHSLLGGGSGIDPVELGGSVVDKLVSYLPDQDGSQYHIVTDNFFTTVQLLKHSKTKACLLPAQYEQIKRKKFLCKISR